MTILAAAGFAEIAQEEAGRFFLWSSIYEGIILLVVAGILMASLIAAKRFLDRPSRHHSDIEKI